MYKQRQETLQNVDWIRVISDWLDLHDIDPYSVPLTYGVSEFFKYTPLKKYGAFNGSPKDLKEGGAGISIYWNEDKFGSNLKIPVVTIKSFKHGGEDYTFSGFQYLKENKEYPSISEKEIRRQCAKAEEYRIKREEREKTAIRMKEVIEKTEQSVISFFKNASPIEVGSSFEHEYFTKKKIELQQAISLGIKFASNIMYHYVGEDASGAPRRDKKIYASPRAMIPMYNMEGEVKSVEFINEKGSKIYAQGYPMAGLFFIIGEITDDTKTIGFSESFFTGQKINSLTGEPVVCCFNAGNIRNVVSQFVEKYQENKELIIYCDNDWGNDIKNTTTNIVATYAGKEYHDQLISYSKDEHGYVYQNIEKSKNGGLRYGIASAIEFGIKYCVPFFDKVGVYNPSLKMPNDFEDLLNATGKDETIRQLRENIFPKPYGSDNKYSAQEGWAVLKDLIYTWFDSDGSLICKVTTGTGKTTIVVDAIVELYEKNPNIRIRLLFPTKKLCNEVHQQLLEKCPSIKSRVLYGRAHEIEKDKTMCEKAHVVNAAASRGQPVYFQFCSHPTDGKCSQFDNCEYIKQYKDCSDLNVVLQPHAILPSISGFLESLLPYPDRIIIDEKCYDYFHGHFDLSEDQFLMPCNPNNEVVSEALSTGIASFDEHRYKILDCLRDTENSLNRLRRDVGLEALEQILADIPSFENPSIKPAMDATEQERLINEHSELTGKWWNVKKIIKLMIEELSNVPASDNQESNGFDLTVSGENLTFVGNDENGNPVYDLTGHKTGRELMESRQQKPQAKRNLYKVRMRHDEGGNFISVNWKKDSDRLRPQGNIAAKEILKYLQKNDYRKFEESDFDIDLKDVNVRSGINRLLQVGLVSKQDDILVLDPLSSFEDALLKLEQPINTLVIDANARKEIWDAILPENKFDFKEINVKQNLSVTQLTSSSGSRRSIELSDNLPNLLKELATPYLESGDEILIIGYQNFVGNKQKGIPAHPIMQEMIDEYGELIKTAYHGNIRGYNTFKHINVEFIIGRNLPPTDAVEDIACAFWNTESNQTLNLTGNYSKKTFGLRLENGGSYPLDNLRHDDEFVDIFRSMICNDETEQEIGRVRAVHSEIRKEVFLLSNEVIPGITPRKLINSSVVHSNQNIRDARVEQICDLYFPDYGQGRKDGFSNCMPLSPRLLFESSNGLFKSEHAAQAWLKRMGLQGIGRSATNKLLQHTSFVNKLSKMGNVEWCVMEYRPEGQKRTSFMLYTYRKGGAPKINTANSIAWKISQVLGCKVTLENVDVIEGNVSVDDDMQSYIMRMVDQLAEEVTIEEQESCVHARYDCDTEDCKHCPNYHVQDKKFSVEIAGNIPVLKEAFQIRLE